MCDTAGFVRHCANTGMVCTHTHYRHSVCEYRYGVENPDPWYTHDKLYPQQTVFAVKKYKSHHHVGLATEIIQFMEAQTALTKVVHLA